MPVTFTSVKASQLDDKVNIEWTVTNELNIHPYEVERSVNGFEFTTNAIITPIANNGSSGSYHSIDKQPANGYNYYRIRSLDIDGKLQYTSIVKIQLGDVKTGITVYPNPIANAVINLRLVNQPAGIYGIRLINELGQAVISRQIKHAEGSSTEVIHLGAGLKRGRYQLEVIQQRGNKKIIEIIY